MVDYIKTFCVVDHRVKSHTKKDVQVFCHLVYSWISIFLLLLFFSLGVGMFCKLCGTLELGVTRRPNSVGILLFLRNSL